jgi:hypothetical protein
LNTNATPCELEITRFADPRFSNRVFRAIVEFPSPNELRMIGKMRAVTSEKGPPKEFDEKALLFKRTEVAQQHGGQISSEGAPSAPPNESSP